MDESPEISDEEISVDELPKKKKAKVRAKPKPKPKPKTTPMETVSGDEEDSLINGGQLDALPKKKHNAKRGKGNRARGNARSKGSASESSQDEYEDEKGAEGGATSTSTTIHRRSLRSRPASISPQS